MSQLNFLGFEWRHLNINLIFIYGQIFFNSAPSWGVYLAESALKPFISALYSKSLKRIFKVKLMICSRNLFFKNAVFVLHKMLQLFSSLPDSHRKCEQLEYIQNQRPQKHIHSVFNGLFHWYELFTGAITFINCLLL